MSFNFHLPNDGKIKVVDLSSFFSPEEILKQSVELNIRLMKWQNAPEIDVEKLMNSRVLIIGCGTLGCNVIRGLLAWGVHKFTLIDSGDVGPSNPARQSLFTVRQVGTNKADAAAESILQIRPDCDVQSFAEEILMPGHLTRENNPEDPVERHIKFLKGHILNTDVCFLLTDSRESRYLPSLLFAHLENTRQLQEHVLCLTVALGFDSFVVLQHGTSLNKTSCYFCNDVTAPTNSTSNRTLDQQCTVTRPGCSSMAAGLAVEHAASQLLGGREKGMGRYQSTLRGDINGAKLVHCESDSNPNCLCCSDSVLKELRGLTEDEASQRISEVLYDMSKVESWSGLTEVRKKLDEMTEGVHDDF